MPSFVRYSVACSLMLASPFAATGDLIALDSMKDNTLYESSTGALSNGAGSAMFAGRSSQSTESTRRALLAFDVAGAIPAGSTIASVTLSLTNSANNTTIESVSLHRLLADWGEGTSVASGGQGGGAPATAGDATWLHRNFNSTFWASAGGDFAAAASAQDDVGGPGEYNWSSPGLVTDVQAFLDAPEGNFGWLLLGNESVSGSAKKFSTREESDVDSRPRLLIEYTVPEPATGLIVMLAGAGAIALRRR